uniref:Hydroxymethylglutaryl-coenzyme A synthase C-terminal domain-containing protein n=1 Tax=Euplotes harpa TaxID=151035 RepID=A0A7S3NGB9_9SPIT|mmetsp:Transcript_42830/g.50222  ORF Transcript_42830/g.50222 Transcript_42830/m.50222 type:complete len:125 (+) Transcript_42830:1047-1421(+)
MFSYGSGCAASMFTIQATDKFIGLRSSNFVKSIEERLNNRIKKSPEEYTDCLMKREEMYTKNGYEATSPIDELFPGTYYLEKVDEKWRRYYQRKPSEMKKITPFKSENISFNSRSSKIFALSKM